MPILNLNGSALKGKHRMLTGDTVVRDVQLAEIPVSSQSQFTPAVEETFGSERHMIGLAVRAAPAQDHTAA